MVNLVPFISNENHLQIRELLSELEQNEPKEIITSPGDYQIPYDVQPANGNVYFLAWNNTSTTLPLSSGFTKFGRKITLINVGGNGNINLASDSSNDIVVYNGIGYDNRYYFKLDPHGFVELLHTSGGWYVTSSFGLNAISKC